MNLRKAVKIIREAKGHSYEDTDKLLKETCNNYNNGIVLPIEYFENGNVSHINISHFCGAYGIQDELFMILATEESDLPEDRKVNYKSHYDSVVELIKTFLK